MEKDSRNLEALKNELNDCKAGNADLTRKIKIKISTSELETTNAYQDSINKGSKKVDHILSNQVLDSAKHGFGFTMSIHLDVHR